MIFVLEKRPSVCVILTGYGLKQKQCVDIAIFFCNKFKSHCLIKRTNPDRQTNGRTRHSDIRMEMKKNYTQIEER